MGFQNSQIVFLFDKEEPINGSVTGFPTIITQSVAKSKNIALHSVLNKRNKPFLSTPSLLTSLSKDLSFSKCLMPFNPN